MKIIILAVALVLGVVLTLAQKPQPTPKPRVKTEASPSEETKKSRSGAAQQKEPTVQTSNQNGNNNNKTQTVKSNQAGQTDMPCCGGGMNAKRITAEDISRTSQGQDYVVDLTKQKAIVDLDSTKEAINFNRIMIRTSAGQVSMESLLSKLLPNSADRSVLRVGNPHAMRRSTQGRVGKNNFTCSAGEPCTCTGDEDCNDMFGAGVCGDIAVCNPNGCACLPPIRN